MTLPFSVTTHDDRVRFVVHVQPNASRSEIVGVHGDALKVRLAAPPVDGAANDALVALLSNALACPRGAIRITHGALTRRKTVEVVGCDVQAIVALLYD
jgi:uncharacterized protein (TIGR00251 family)